MLFRSVDFGDTSRLFSQINNPVITIRFDSCYNLLTFETLASSHTNNKSSVLGWLLNPYNPNYTSSLGQGIEFPIPFIGDGAHRRLIIPSNMGNSTDMANVVPYYYRNIYFDEAYQYPD